MSVTSTVLVFVGIPLVVVAIVAGLVFGGSAGRRARRYRPGRPYDFAPIWFLASPEQVAGPTGGRAQTPAIESGVVETDARVPAGSTGGASDRW